MLTLYREAKQRMAKGGGDKKSGAEPVPDPIEDTGRSRLKRESPKLFKAVCDGRMSANAAAIKAGVMKHLENVRNCRQIQPRLPTRGGSRRYPMDASETVGLISTIVEVKSLPTNEGQCAPWRTITTHITNKRETMS